MKRSLAWVAVEIGGTTGITVLTVLLMARMMTPEQFGTGALVLGSIGFLNLYVGGFFHDALIQNPHTDDDTFEAALTVTILIGVMIVVTSTAIAAFFRLGNAWVRAEWLFVGASLMLPFGGVLGIISARMRRDLVFREIAQGSLVGRLTGCAIGLILAYAGLGATSLIAQAVTDAASQSVLLMVRSGWRPRPRFALAKLRPICRFALPYAMMHSILAARVQVFLMMITGFINLTATGFVNVAFRITYTPQIVLATSFTNFGLPILAHHHNSASGVEEAFRFVSRLVLSLTVPAFVGLALVADELMPMLLGAEWASVVPLVQIMAVGVATIFLRFPASSLLRALGYVRFSFASSLFQTAFTLIAMAVLRPQDLRAVVWLWVLPAAIQLPVALVAACRVSVLKWRSVVASLLPILMSTLAMTIVVLLLARKMDSEPALFRLAIEIVFGSLVVFGTLLATDRWLRRQLVGFIKRVPRVLGKVL